jgi:hypothetical protein
MLYWTDGVGHCSDVVPEKGVFCGSRGNIMAESQLTLSAEEREYLANLLETVLKEKRVEEHRTRTLTYRQYVVHEEDVINSLLSKLGRPPS